MEMRLLTTDGERNVFAQRLADARAGHGASYRDAGESHAEIWSVWPPQTSTGCSKQNVILRNA